MALETLFKTQHKMRGAETLKMSNDRPYRFNRRLDDGLHVPPWVWAIIVSLGVQILGAAYVTGRVTEKLEGVGSRVSRLESVIDRYFGNVKP